MGLKALNEMQELFIIDSAGVRFDLGRVRLARPKPPHGIRWWLARATNRTVAIEFDKVLPAGQLTVEEVRAFMRKDIRREPDYWSERDDLEELERDIEGIDNVPGLIAWV